MGFISFPFFHHGWCSRAVQRISRFRRFYCDNYWRNAHLSAILWSISNVQPNALHRLSQAYSTAQIKRLTITHKRKMLQNPYSECMRCAFLNRMNKTKEKSIKMVLMDANLIQKPIIQKWTFRFSYLQNWTVPFSCWNSLSCCYIRLMHLGFVPLHSTRLPFLKEAQNWVVIAMAMVIWLVNEY